MEEIICNNCGWAGDVSMLVSLTESMEDECNKCPDCESDDIEDFE